MSWYFGYLKYRLIGILWSLPAFAIAVALHLSGVNWVIRPFLALYFVALLRLYVAREFSRVFADGFKPSTGNVFGLIVEISAYALTAVAMLTANPNHSGTVVSYIFAIFGLLLIAEFVPNPNRRTQKLGRKSWSGRTNHFT
jgi:hypothetical protein